MFEVGSHYKLWGSPYNRPLDLLPQLPGLHSRRAASVSLRFSSTILHASFLLATSTGSFVIPLNVGPHLAPVATLLVYTLHPEREVVADTARFQVEKCFRNKVRPSLLHTEA